MKRTVLLLSALLLGAPELDAQDGAAVARELESRGATPEFAARVRDVVERASTLGLPVEPVAGKAYEGWAKRTRIPPDRVLAALDQLVGDLERARALATEAGMANPPGPVVAAAAASLGRGMTPEDVRSVIGAARGPEQAAAGLEVAGSLAAQGLEHSAAVRAVTDAMARGQGAGSILELPSAVTGLRGRGVPMSDIARSILEGRGIELPGAAGGAGPASGGRPPIVPPGRRNRPDNPGNRP